MLFPSILTGCLGPSGEFWTLLRCGPDVSAGAVEGKPGAAPSSKWLGLWTAGLSSCLGQVGSALGTFCVGEGRSRSKEKLARGVFSEKWAVLPDHRWEGSEPATHHPHRANCPQGSKLFMGLRTSLHLVLHLLCVVCTDPLFSLLILYSSFVL